MHSRLREIMGDEEAASLMEHLPPVGWAEVATKTDLENLRAATKSDIENLAAATKHILKRPRPASPTSVPLGPIEGRTSRGGSNRPRLSELLLDEVHPRT